MSDIEYLSAIADADKIPGSSLVFATGSIRDIEGTDATGQTLASYTPPTGSTFFLVEASVGVMRGGNLSWLQLLADLRLATDQIDHVTAGSGGLQIGSGGAGGAGDQKSKFQTRGNKLIGNGESSIAIHDIEHHNEAATVDVYGVIQGFLIDTGESPVLP